MRKTVMLDVESLVHVLQNMYFERNSTPLSLRRVEIDERYLGTDRNRSFELVLITKGERYGKEMIFGIITYSELCDFVAQEVKRRDEDDRNFTVRICSDYGHGAMVRVVNGEITNITNKDAADSGLKYPINRIHSLYVGETAVSAFPQYIRESCRVVNDFCISFETDLTETEPTDFLDVTSRADYTALVRYETLLAVCEKMNKSKVGEVQVCSVGMSATGYSACTMAESFIFVKGDGNAVYMRPTKELGKLIESLINRDKFDENRFYYNIAFGDHVFETEYNLWSKTFKNGLTKPEERAYLHLHVEGHFFKLERGDEGYVVTETPNNYMSAENFDIKQWFLNDTAVEGLTELDEVYLKYEDDDEEPAKREEVAKEVDTHKQALLNRIAEMERGLTMLKAELEGLEV